MSVHGPVVVATDLSAFADEALRQGAMWADTLRSRLIVCHVLPEMGQVRVLFPHLAGADHDVLAALADRAATAVAARVKAVIGRTLDADDISVESGSPHLAIRAMAERCGAGLVVIGPGSTAARLAHAATWSVLVARHGPIDGGVLAATDFSDPALPAVAAAVHEARRRGVGLRLIHAVHVDPALSLATLGPPVMPVRDDVATALVEQAREDLEAALRHFHAVGEAIVVRGPATTSIVDTAAQHPTALIVVGTHGRTGLQRLLLGSVADAVLRSAPCSVLAVPLKDVETTDKASAA
jgi:nucleotide-binding universal stress UspA family protein